MPKHLIVVVLLCVALSNGNIAIVDAQGDELFTDIPSLNCDSIGKTFNSPTAGYCPDDAEFACWSATILSQRCPVRCGLCTPGCKNLGPSVSELGSLLRPAEADEVRDFSCPTVERYAALVQLHKTAADSGARTMGCESMIDICPTICFAYHYKQQKHAYSISQKCSKSCARYMGPSDVGHSTCFSASCNSVLDGKNCQLPMVVIHDDTSAGQPAETYHITGLDNTMAMLPSSTARSLVEDQALAFGNSDLPTTWCVKSDAPAVGQTTQATGSIAATVLRVNSLDLNENHVTASVCTTPDTAPTLTVTEGDDPQQCFNVTENLEHDFDANISTLSVPDGTHTLCERIFVPDGHRLIIEPLTSPIIPWNDTNADPPLLSDVPVLQCDRNFAFQRTDQCVGLSVLDLGEASTFSMRSVGFVGCPRLANINLEQYVLAHDKLGPRFELSRVVVEGAESVASDLYFFTNLNYPDFIDGCLEGELRSRGLVGSFGGAVLHVSGVPQGDPRTPYIRGVGEAISVVSPCCDSPGHIMGCPTLEPALGWEPYENISAKISIQSCRMSGNKATNGGLGRGGIILADQVNYLEIAFIDSLIHGNSASTSGGVVYLQTSIKFRSGVIHARVRFERSTVANNTVDGDGGVFVINGPGAEALVLNSTLTGNLAGHNGGVGATGNMPDRTIVHIKGSVLSDNHALLDGGVLHLSSPQDDQQQLLNSIKGFPVSTTTNPDPKSIPYCSKTTIETSQMRNNFADGSGGAVAVVGGLVTLHVVKQSVFDGNRAKLGGGVLHVLGPTAYMLESVDYRVYKGVARVLFEDSMILNNNALDGAVFMFERDMPAQVYINGMKMHDNHAYRQGGILYLELDTAQSLYANSQKPTQAPVQAPSLAPFTFGFPGFPSLNEGLSSHTSSIADHEAPVVMENSEVVNNTAVSGGVFSIAGQVPVRVTGNSFLENRARDGAVISVSGQSTIEFNGTTFIGNVASGNGGVAWLGGSNVATMRCISCDVSLNTAAGAGGVALIGENSVASFESSSTIKENTALFGGVAFLTTPFSSMSVTDSDITSNHALNNGGVISMPVGAQVSLVDVIVNQNKAGNSVSGQGGVFFVHKSIDSLALLSGGDSNVVSLTGELDLCALENTTLCIKHVDFVNNTAYIGSVMYFAFANNITLEQIGTLTDSAQKECLNIPNQPLTSVEVCHYVAQFDTCSCLENHDLLRATSNSATLSSDYSPVTSEPQRTVIESVNNDSEAFSTRPMAELASFTATTLDAFGMPVAPVLGLSNMFLTVLEVSSSNRNGALSERALASTYLWKKEPFWMFGSNAAVNLEELVLYAEPRSNVSVLFGPLKGTLWDSHKDLRGRVSATLKLKVLPCNNTQQVQVASCDVFESMNNVDDTDLVTNKCADVMTGPDALLPANQALAKCVPNNFVCPLNTHVPLDIWKSVLGMQDDFDTQVGSVTASQVSSLVNMLEERRSFLNVTSNVNTAAVSDSCVPCTASVPESFRRETDPVWQCTKSGCGGGFLPAGPNECVVCPAGNYCDSSIKKPCEKGYFCPEKSSAQQLCPQNTYSQNMRVEASDDCRSCPEWSKDAIIRSGNKVNVQTLVDSVADDVTKCVPCRSGQQCSLTPDDKSALFHAQPGYFVYNNSAVLLSAYYNSDNSTGKSAFSGEAPPRVFKCFSVVQENNATACNNNEQPLTVSDDKRGRRLQLIAVSVCDEGYMGPLCLQCERGYARDGAYGCNACIEGKIPQLYFWLLVMCLLGWLFVMIFAGLRRAGETSKFLVMRMLTAHVQMLATIIRLPFAWKDVGSFALFKLGEAVPGAGSVGLACVFDRPKWTFFAYATAVVLIPVFALNVAGIYWLYRHYYNPPIDLILRPKKRVIVVNDDDDEFDELRGGGGPGVDGNSIVSAKQLQHAAVAQVAKMDEEMGHSGSRDGIVSIGSINRSIGVGGAAAVIAPEGGDQPDEFDTNGGRDVTPLTHMISTLTVRSDGIADDSLVKLFDLTSWLSKQPPSFRRFLLSLFIVLQVMHLQLLRTGLDFFSCIRLDADDLVLDEPLLRTDPHIVCGSARHQSFAFGFGLPLILLVGAGFPFGTFVFLKTTLNKHRKRLRHLQDFGIIYSAFRPKYYWWEAVVMIRLSILVLSSVLLQSYPAAQVSVFVLLVVVSMCMVLYARPYVDIWYTLLEFSSSACAFIAMVGGLLLLPLSDEQVNENVLAAGRTISKLCVWIPNLLFVLACLYVQSKVLHNSYIKTGVLKQRHRTLVRLVQGYVGRVKKKKKSDGGSGGDDSKALEIEESGGTPTEQPATFGYGEEPLGAGDQDGGSATHAPLVGAVERSASGLVFVDDIDNDNRISVAADGSSDGGGLNEHVDIGDDADAPVALQAVALE